MAAFDRRAALAHAIVSIAAVAVFARALPYPLQRSWDDGRFIVDNPHLQRISIEGLRYMFGAPRFEAYHPLHLLSYWLDVPFAGAHPLTLHAVSLLLWVAALNVWLRAYVRLGLSVSAAVIATLACGLHPIQVEAVSWASGRKDVLALLFAGAAALLHLRADGRVWPRALSTGAFLFAALSKTTVLPLPLVLVLADVALRGRTLRAALRAQATSLVLAAGFAAGVVAIWSEHEMIRATAGGLAALPARVVATVQHQLATALWPSSNAPMYSTVAVGQPSPFAWLLFAALSALGLYAYRRGARRALFTLAAFALLLLPVSNALPMYFPFQDRYLSLPLVALAFGLGALFDAVRADARGRWPVALFASMVVALGLRCIQYQGEWASEARLWGHAASTQPDAYYAWMKLGEVRRRAGDLYGAIRAYKTVVGVDPQRKLGYAALLASVAERDEKLQKLSPPAADRYAQQFYAALDDAQALRSLARRLLAAGYVRAVELPLARSLLVEPLPDEALERAARAHFEAGRDNLGWLFLSRMQKRSTRPALLEAGERARLRLSSSPL